MKKLLFFILIFVSTLIISCQKTEKFTLPVRLQGPVFGTTYSIIYYDVATNFEKEINQLFEEVNQSTSTYIYSSDISRINRGEKGVKVDEYFQEVFLKIAQIFVFTTNESYELIYKAVKLYKLLKKKMSR